MIQLSNLPAFFSEFHSHPTPNFNYGENKENIAVENLSEVDDSKNLNILISNPHSAPSAVQRIMKDIQLTLNEYKQYYKVEKLEIQLSKLGSMLKQDSKTENKFKLKYKQLKRQYRAK